MSVVSRYVSVHASLDLSGRYVNINLHWYCMVWFLDTIATSCLATQLLETVAMCEDLLECSVVVGILW